MPLFAYNIDRGRDVGTVAPVAPYPLFCIRLGRSAPSAANRAIMGIRFNCPNGHKLNVKSFLAGKRGICPHCGAKVLIPRESTRPSSKELREAQAAGGGPKPTPRPLPMNHGAGGAEPATSTPADPIAEAPDAVWYVRPPSGGQYGPAPGETMRRWIAEGRVSADTMVWRDGWPDWKLASAVFPDLAAGGSSIPTGIQPTDDRESQTSSAGSSPSFPW